MQLPNISPSLSPERNDAGLDRAYTSPSAVSQVPPRMRGVS